MKCNHQPLFVALTAADDMSDIDENGKIVKIRN